MNPAADPVVAEFADYSNRLQEVLQRADFAPVAALARAIQECWREERCLYFCGNGGSAGNAVHLANDFVYGIAMGHGVGMRAHALSANTSVLTCLANDIDYSEIFSAQLRVFGRRGDLLVALSGSGNSPNILKAITVAKELAMPSYAVLGYRG